MADEPKQEILRAQDAIRRSMEAGGTAPPPGTRTVQPPTGPLPIEQRAEAAQTGRGSITQSLADARTLSSQIDERLFGGGGVTPDLGGSSVQDNLRVHVAWLAHLLARL